jgi:thiamine biosynthesis lipoprotein
MGTTATITVLHEERATARAMVETAFAEIERLERILSRQQYGTAVHRLNQFGRLPEPPAELVTILDHARHYSLLTEGAFDITVAPLIDLYAMRFVVAGRPPSESEIRVLRERISWKSVTVDGRGVTFEEKGTAISVDGIAKGFVVDRTCTVLAAAGADQVLVGAGGDIAAGSAESWRVAVRDPHDAARDVGIVRPTNHFGGRPRRRCPVVPAIRSSAARAASICSRSWYNSARILLTSIVGNKSTKILRPHTYHDQREWEPLLRRRRPSHP